MPVSPSTRFLLLYGSQTGQAQAICEEIVERSSRHNLHPELHCLSLTEKKFFLERETCVVIVISTTGDGEPPDTALKFVRRLKKKTLASDYLSKLNYTLLGLGDSNYTNFCNCGKTLDKRLHELGAKRFYDCAWADDAVGLEGAVDPWIDNLWAALKKFLNLPIQQDTITNLAAGEMADFPAQSNVSDSVPENPKTSNVTTDNQSNEVVSTGDHSGLNNDTKTIIKQSSHASVMSENNAEVSSNSSVETDIKASIRQSIPPLSESALSLPVLPPSYLKVNYLPDSKICINDLPRQNGFDFPSSSTPVTLATMTELRRLTSDNSVKRAMLVELDISGSNIGYQPGDSISVICPNDPVEVTHLLQRLGVHEEKDTCIQISIIDNTKKRNACVPKYIPEICTLNYIFSTCVDIREPPKKAFLRALVEYTSDVSEKRRLQELCSKQGSNDYTEFIRQPNLCILDILNHLSSCRPSVECLIEHLPRLQPRPYSVCTSPLTSPGKLQFVFNVVDITKAGGRTYSRKGVCTGWIEHMCDTVPFVHGKDVDSETEEATNKLDQMSTTDKLIPVYGRTSQSFHLPDDVSVPLILIGPGTGVAPFIGYLDHRCCQRESQPDNEFGNVWLFYGCRHQERDYLFRDKLQEHLLSSTLTKLLVSFSRDDQPVECPRYVQDNIRVHGADIVEMIEEDNAVVYVCGDANNMAKDVNQAFIDVFSEHKGISADEARKLMMKLRLAKRYKEDVWT